MRGFFRRSVPPFCWEQSRAAGSRSEPGARDPTAQLDLFRECKRLRSCPVGNGASGAAARCTMPGELDLAALGPKLPDMKRLSSNSVASLLLLAVVASAAPAAANSLDSAQPQCGDDKKESKGGDKKSDPKDDKTSDTKPKPPVQG